MNTQASNTATPSTTSTPCACVPCEIPAFCRTSYYTGKLLTARDFSGEQSYHVDKRRLHNVSLHGWGAVCGLKIEPHPYCPDLRIVVKAGLAIDQCGREVRLLADVELALPQPIAQPSAPAPCPPDPAAQPPPAASAQPPPAASAQPPPAASAEPVPVASAQPPPAPPERESLWVSLCYCERPEQFSPAPFDECACTGTAQKPNCVCESYCLELTTKEPKCLSDVEEHKRCSFENCADLYKSILDECKPVACDCVPLAVIRDFIPGMIVEERMIDNWTHRLLLPSVHRLDRVIRCLVEKIPPPRHLTHICDLNWTPGTSLRSREFFNRFVAHDKGFEIRFDDRVRKEGINRRTFQAMVVHHSGSPDQPERMEIAPAHVDILSETHIRLRIDERYARRSLDEHNFDLFITLKCDVIVDHRGIAVDGNLLARLEDGDSTYFVDAPTGDGVPGGLFESWLRVLSGEDRPERW